MTGGIFARLADPRIEAQVRDQPARGAEPRDVADHRGQGGGRRRTHPWQGHESAHVGRGEDGSRKDPVKPGDLEVEEVDHPEARFDALFFVGWQADLGEPVSSAPPE
jgi:hypothetical protein